MATPTPEELQAAGLYDPADPLAAERLALIDYLVGLGATVEEMAAAGGELAGVASTRALRGPGERFTQAEAAARAGVPLETCVAFWRASGFPDPGPTAKVCTDEDVETLRIFEAGAALLGRETILQIARVIGTSMARVADATVAAFLTRVAAPAMADDPGGLRLAQLNTESVALLRQASGPIDAIFRRHVELFQRPLNADAEGTQDLAVGFVDLVGSTALAQELSVAELGSVLAEFDELLSGVVVDRNGRVVKLIGDEVMYVAAAPSAACDIACTALQRLAAHPRLPPGRAGVASGPVLSRDGDYFGPVVNLAARIVKLAEPGSLLVSAPVVAAAEGLAFASIGARDLKGFDALQELFALDAT